MEIWQAEPGDVVRLPASCWPREVSVTDSEYASGGEYNRIHWEAGRAHGSTVLPDRLNVDLLDTERQDKRPFMTPESRPEPEAEP